MKHTYFTPYDMPSVLQGHRPWSGAPPENKKDKPKEKTYSKGDSKEQIEDCLWCWLPDCVDCILSPHKRKDNPAQGRPRSSRTKEKSPERPETSPGEKKNSTPLV